MVNTGARYKVHSPIFLWVFKTINIKKRFNITNSEKKKWQKKLFLNDMVFWNVLFEATLYQKCNEIKSFSPEVTLPFRYTVTLKHAKLLPNSSRMSWIWTTKGFTKYRDALIKQTPFLIKGKVSTRTLVFKDELMVTGLAAILLLCYLRNQGSQCKPQMIFKMQKPLCFEFSHFCLS